jgi:hypothetical protein
MVDVAKVVISLTTSLNDMYIDAIFVSTTTTETQFMYKTT